MNQQTYVKVSGVIFGVVAAVHAWRLYRGFGIMVGSHIVPTWASIASVVVAGFLAFTALKKTT